jgi:hypothetical protein
MDHYGQEDEEAEQLATPNRRQAQAQAAAQRNGTRANANAKQINDFSTEGAR